MISSKKLIRLARKWQKLAVLRRKRISFQKTTASTVSEGPCSTSTRTDKGHFVVYSADNIRFMIPIVYLQNEIFKELLQVAEEEFGLPRDRPITLPCDGIFMEYALSLIKRNVAGDLEKALLSIASSHCLPPPQLLQDQRNYQSPICSF